MLKQFNSAYFEGMNVLITGGTGSFGQKAVAVLLAETQVKKVIVFSRDELKQYEMQQQFKAEPRIRFFIGDVRDLARLKMAFRGVDYVIHAAALKQVPALEYNPFEAVKTNVVGTQNVIEAAIQIGVKKVILLSTDKAANPANLYGATKLCAERLMVSANAYGAGQALFSAVRYGNVFGSRGSLAKLIESQKARGVITLTHPDMTRFWITLRQGVNFVLNSLALMKGGEIFVPKIPSMKVRDFITSLAPECKIEIIGIRPGEKIHEKLITEEEGRQVKEFDRFFIIEPLHDWWSVDNHNSGFKKVSDPQFTFSSDSNADQLEMASLLKLIDQDD